MSAAFPLPEELTIYTVSQTRQDLLAWLDTQTADATLRRHLQAGTVSDVDGAGLQLLGALANALAARGETLVLAAPSAALRQVCAQLGCTGWFQFQASEDSP